MKNTFLNLVLLVLLVGLTNARGQRPDSIVRFVKDRTLVSRAFPDIKVKVDRNFKYVGNFDFNLKGVAKGERFVFVDAKKHEVQRIFIAHFESFLPENNQVYRYDLQNAPKIGKHSFLERAFAFSNQKAGSDPTGEAALTMKFLRDKGYVLEDEMMMSGFITVPDAEKKHELILLYAENVSQTNHQLSEFYANNVETEIWKQISAKLTQRSAKAFSIERKN